MLTTVHTNNQLTQSCKLRTLVTDIAIMKILHFESIKQEVPVILTISRQQSVVSLKTILVRCGGTSL